ncbi:MFS transporter [Streptomyces sp. NPDC000151]|uniref:MFS transporter n=1 Tax=Streptomyces sp. NPDC000151 TaxID=3154244 RepID=UPI003323AF34
MELTAIDDAPTTRFHRKLTVSCSGGPLLDGYLLTIIGVALTGVTKQLSLTDVTAGLVGVAALVGMFFGGLVIGPLCNALGRRLLYLANLVVLLVASLASALATEAWQLIALRFVIGMAVGADYPIATSLMAEWLPRRARGRMMGTLIVGWFVGAMLSYLIGYLLVETVGDSAWRWMQVSCALLTLIVLLLRLGTPESPRWLASKGRLAEAQELVEKVLSVKVADADIRRAAQAPTHPQARARFRGTYLRRILYCTGFYTCNIIPLWAMYIFGPTILKSLGFGSGNDSNLGSLLLSVFFLAGCFPAMWLIERVGRRPSNIWSFALSAIPFLVLAIWPDASPAAVLLCFAAYAILQGPPGILQWIYPNEVFPTSIRASAVGHAVAWSRIGAAVGTYLIPLSLSHIGPRFTMLIGAVVLLIGWLISVLWAEETRGKSLEEAAAPTETSTAPLTDTDTGTGTGTGTGTVRTTDRSTT